MPQDNSQNSGAQTENMAQQAGTAAQAQQAQQAQEEAQENLEQERKRKLAEARQQELEQKKQAALEAKRAKEEEKKEDEKGKKSRAGAGSIEYIFAMLLAIVKDLLDPVSDLATWGITALLGAMQAMVTVMTSWLNLIPVLGTATAVGINFLVATIFGGIGFSTEVVTFIIRGMLSLMIFVLIGRRVSPLKKMLILGVSLVDLVPFIRNIPAETATVIATYAFSTVEKYAEPIKNVKRAARRARKGAQLVKRGGRNIARAARKVAAAVA